MAFHDGPPNKVLERNDDSLAPDTYGFFEHELYASRSLSCGHRAWSLGIIRT
jgi:hypothetical protein